MTKAKQRYKAKIIKLQVDLYPTDKDIIEALQKVNSKATYIKQLIREDIKKEKGA